MPILSPFARRRGQGGPVMQWRLHPLGFLPLRDPAACLSDPAFVAAEQLAADLPRLVREGTFRTACVNDLGGSGEGVPVPSDEHDAERLFMLYSYFASAFVHAPGLPPTDRLPAPIAVPLERLAAHLGRPPILAYASYCLHNWARIDPAGPVALGNIRLLQNFSEPDDGKGDEDWFILVHVDIEARAGAALRALDAAGDVIARDDAAGMEATLTAVERGLSDMNRTLARMPERCRPEVYFRKVRPYIFGFTGVAYEGSPDPAPRTYRGETGAQSSIVPSLLASLGIRHADSLLTTHLADMRNYMPPAHREFVANRPSVREYVTRESGRAPGLRGAYNACVEQLVTFRSRHFDYAVNYIERRVENPTGTGGTPYIPWLRRLIEETREHLLP